MWQICVWQIHNHIYLFLDDPCTYWLSVCMFSVCCACETLWKPETVGDLGREMVDVHTSAYYSTWSYARMWVPGLWLMHLLVAQALIAVVKSIGKRLTVGWWWAFHKPQQCWKFPHVFIYCRMQIKQNRMQAEVRRASNTRSVGHLCYLISRWKK